MGAEPNGYTQPELDPSVDCNIMTVMLNAISMADATSDKYCLSATSSFGCMDMFTSQLC